MFHSISILQLKIFLWLLTKASMTIHIILQTGIYLHSNLIVPERRKMCKPDGYKVWLLQVIVFLGLLAFFLWLGLRPNEPTYTILDFTVLVPNNGNNTTIVNENGTLLYNLEIWNPNTDSSIYYDDILLMFYHNQDTVGQKNIPHFHQGTDKRFTKMDQVDVDAKVWKTLVNAISNKTSEPKADIVTRIRYQTWGVKSKHHKMHMEGNLQIGSDGKLTKKKKIKLKRSKKLRMKFTWSLGFRTAVRLSHSYDILYLPIFQIHILVIIRALNITLHYHRHPFVL